MKISERIRLIRKENGISQNEFGKRIGISRDTVANIECDRMEPKEIHILAVCREFGISKDWLLTGEGEMEAPKSHEEEIAEISAKLFNEKDPLRKELLSLISDMGQDELDAVAKLRTYIDKKTKK